MPSPRLQASHCFAFEHDFVGSWRCIPLCVRRKLDLIGLKLKLSHWLELSQGQRQQLVDWPDQAEAWNSYASSCRPGRGPWPTVKPGRCRLPWRNRGSGRSPCPMKCSGLPSNGMWR